MLTPKFDCHQLEEDDGCHGLAGSGRKVKEAASLWQGLASDLTVCDKDWAQI